MAEGLPGGVQPPEEKNQKVMNSSVIHVLMVQKL